ncbi:MAG: hypothetical protein R3245_05110 [Kiloniellales bacterium]|nr:hypothetical protein [Kiloniellales bacterium]
MGSDGTRAVRAASSSASLPAFRRRAFPLSRFIGFLADKLGVIGKESSAAKDHSVSAIVGYAEFIEAHPDMPRAHKTRFLEAIMRCCEESRHRTASFSG